MARKKGTNMDTHRALVDAALELIGTVGFDAASVDAIVARAGLSKGTFFYFFPTKQDLLETVCEHLALEGWETVKPVFDEPGDPLLRLARYLSQARRFRVARAGAAAKLWDALAKDENMRVRVRIEERQRELVRPSVTRLIEEGTAAGLFQVADAEVTSELLLEFAAVSGNGTMRLLRSGGPTARDGACRRVNATLEAIERMLGAPRGTLERVTQETLEPFTRKAKRPS